MRKKPIEAKPGECVVCAKAGILPSQAIACALHSEHHIRELKAEIAVLKNIAGHSSKLHLALAEMTSSVPSIDGSSELAYVREMQARLDCLAAMTTKLAAVANYDEDIPPTEARP